MFFSEVDISNLTKVSPDEAAKPGLERASRRIIRYPFGTGGLGGTMLIDVPTVIVTAAPSSTRVPAEGSSPMTMPTWLGSTALS